MLPNFLLIGQAKCGTTSVYTQLGQHPDVFVSDTKEPHFFGRDDVDESLPEYEALFDGVEDESAVGEASTSYTRPDIAERCAMNIARLIPDVRLIYMVRNPIRRLESDWKMRKHQGWAPDGPISEALNYDGRSLIKLGMYWRNLSHYRDRFDEEQILVVFLEEFAECPSEEMERCFSHIGVDPDVPLQDPNRSRYSSSDFREDRLAGRILRKLGLVRVARDLFPSAVFERGKRLFTRPDRYEVEWDPEAKERVVETLAPDARKLLRYCGKPEDYWQLD